MALTLAGDESQRIFFAIYKPLDGHDIDDAAAHIARFTTNLEAEAAILKNIGGSWAAVFAIWKGGSDGDDGSVNLPWDAELRSAVRVVEYAWFRLSSEAHRELSLAKLSVGDIVTVRRMYSEPAKQEVLAYSCLAILKAYFNKIEGLLSATFYRSTDCKRIMGIGLWDGLQSAVAFGQQCDVSRGEIYWKGLDAKMIKYDICRVISVTLPRIEDQITQGSRQI